MLLLDVHKPSMHTERVYAVKCVCRSVHRTTNTRDCGFLVGEEEEESKAVHSFGEVLPARNDSFAPHLSSAALCLYRLWCSHYRSR
ncbi:unnamed protein product [Chondrus crispus]|uniref:Uncharacterized protein n=1 Tax=Chondrus crispus TaxID=2769 RepID=R7QU89_CHOCR|nr:unnamed protein product [Chondrus crispus]CDF41263.1 unnamed protein product [Chondrus crispus]|eukprot:XP_005711557.1 unnamed protein product [Chondrus crispus]